MSVALLSLFGIGSAESDSVRTHFKMLRPILFQVGEHGKLFSGGILEVEGSL